MDFFPSYIQFRKLFQKYIKHIYFRKMAGNKNVEFVINGLLCANTLPSVSCDLVGKDCLVEKNSVKTHVRKGPGQREKRVKSMLQLLVSHGKPSLSGLFVSHTQHTMHHSAGLSNECGY